MKMWLDRGLCVGFRPYKVEYPRLSMVVFGKIAYRLRNDDVAGEWDGEGLKLSGDVHEDEDDTRSLRYSTDFAPFKPNADVLVVGSAHAPRGQPVTTLRVAFSAGGLKKVIGVIGDRQWKGSRLFGQSITDPAPFTSMPLVYERAFGGQGVPANPVGVGRVTDNLPNLESPESLVVSRKHKGPIAGFAPLAPSWQERAAKMGTYKKQYLNTRWPWLPEDFDWTHFNAAPTDQQVKGYLRGDEQLAFEHMHPEHPGYRCRLPGQKMRLFVLERLENGSEDFREVPVVLDTLWADVDEEQVVLTWRGRTRAPSMKLMEIEHLMAIMEPLGAADRGLPWFRRELTRRIENPFEAFLPADVLEQIKELEAEGAAMEKEAREIEAELPGAIAQKQQEIDAGTDEVLAGVGESRDTAPKPPDEDIPEFQQQYAIFEAILSQIRQSKQDLISAEVPQDDETFMQLEQAERQVLEAREKIGADLVPPTREELEAAAGTGASFAKSDLNGVDLSGADLRGLDLSGSSMLGTNLSGANLTGATLDGAIMMKASLRGANLRGASLVGALTPEVDFTDADMRDADLTKMNLVEVPLRGAQFAGATLEQTVLMQQMLDGFDFSGCKGSAANFLGAKLNGARFVGADLFESIFLQAELEGADFSVSNIRKSLFDEAKMRGACLVGADISGLQASRGTDLTGADCRNTKADGATFRSSILDSTCFVGSSMTRCIFAESSLNSTFLDQTRCRHSDFSDAKLTRMRAVGADMLQCTFDRAKINNCTFDDASLFSSGFCETELAGNSLVDANVGRTTLE